MLYHILSCCWFTGDQYIRAFWTESRGFSVIFPLRNPLTWRQLWLKWFLPTHKWGKILFYFINQAELLIYIGHVRLSSGRRTDHGEADAGSVSIRHLWRPSQIILLTQLIKPKFTSFVNLISNSWLLFLRLLNFFVAFSPRPSFYNHRLNRKLQQI